MFNNIPPAILTRMAYLEDLDAEQRRLNRPKDERLRQVVPETGRFLALLAASAPPGAVLEAGASGGYSGLWLALACRLRGDQLTTFDLDPGKVRLAQETFELAQVTDAARIVPGDALAHLPEYARVAFCFLDLEKSYYRPCYDAVVPNLAPGGWLAADNITSHADELKSFVEYVLGDARVDALVVPIGKGVLIARKIQG